MFKLPDSASVAALRGPYGRKVASKPDLRPSTEPLPKKTCPQAPPTEPVPAISEINLDNAPEIAPEIIPDVFWLPTYIPPATYTEAWKITEGVCANYPLKLRGDLDAAQLVLVQMQDTLGTPARLLKWAGTQWKTTRVFTHQEEPVEAFLALLQTARGFGSIDVTAAAAVAVFLYPTAGVLQELWKIKEHRFFGVKVVVVLDDVYCATARELRGVATLAFVEPLGKDAAQKCMNLLLRTWRLPIQSARKDYWLTRAGSDPRLLLHMLYFERLSYASETVGWGANIDLDVFSWVHEWFFHGYQKVHELFYPHPKPSLLTSLPFGVVTHQIRGQGAISLVVWDYAVKKLPELPDSQTELHVHDIDPNIALAYLHWAAPQAVKRTVYRIYTDHAVTKDAVPEDAVTKDVVEAEAKDFAVTGKEAVAKKNKKLIALFDAVAETQDMLSMADLQQNRFDPVVSPLHQGAVRYGVYRATCDDMQKHFKYNDNWDEKKSFYEWLERQRGSKARVHEAFQTEEFAPLIIIHRTETLARLLHVVDPEGDVKYWPSKILPNARAYATEANLIHDNQFQDVGWRLIWRVVDDHVSRLGSLPVRPTSSNPKPFSVITPERVLCPFKDETLKDEPKLHSPFAWCELCSAAPTLPVFRCRTGCLSWGACVVCAALNRILADIVTRACMM